LMILIHISYGYITRSRRQHYYLRAVSLRRPLYDKRCERRLQHVDVDDIAATSHYAADDDALFTPLFSRRCHHADAITCSSAYATFEAESVGREQDHRRQPVPANAVALHRSPRRLPARSPSPPSPRTVQHTLRSTARRSAAIFCYQLRFTASTPAVFRHARQASP